MRFPGYRSWRMRGLQYAAAVVLGIGSVSLAPSARSEDQAPSKSPAPTITDQKINATAAAVAQVVSVRKTFDQKLANAPDSDRPRITKEADDAIEKAITNQGITLADYQTIVEAARTDPMIREKIIEHMPATGP